MRHPFSEQLLSLTKSYLTTDMDAITYEQVSKDIAYIQGILDRSSSVDEMQVIDDLLSKSIAHLYVARGFAASQIPRNYEFYNHIQACQTIFREINKIIE